MIRKFQYLHIFLMVAFLGNATFGQESGKTHINDTTYLLTYDHGGLILWGSDHFRERLDNAIEWLDKYPSFKIGLDNEAQIYDFFAEYEPQMLVKLNDLLLKYKGRFAIGSSTYGQPLSQFINDESNIRQISYALDAERKHFNYRPPVYFMSEHAMHSQMPQILNGFGFDGAIMRTHFMMYGYNPTFDVPIGLWVGLDGSKTATVPTYNGEGAAFGKTTMDTWILTRYPGNDSRESLEVFRKKFEHLNPLLASRADDSGLRKEELVREYETKPKFKWILLDEMLSKYPAPTEEMVTKPNDFIVRMPWGYCGNEIWNESRKAEISILTAERLAALEVMNGGKSHKEDLDISWKNLLLAQHHDIQICGLLSESRKLLPVSLYESGKTIKEAMSFFGENMTGEGFKHIIVFNPLSWKQTRWIYADINLKKGDAKFLVAKCGDKEIPVSIIESNKQSDGHILNAEIAFKAELPPLSFTSYSILPADNPAKIIGSLIKTEEDNLKITTPFYEIQLSGEGGLAYIKNIETGEFITNVAGRASYFEGRINGMVCQSKGRWVIKKSNEPSPSIKMVEYGFISDIPYEFEITLYEDNTRIDCKAKFDFNGQKIGLLSENPRDSHSPFVHEEKLRFKFFANLDSESTGIRDLPFAIAETRNKYIEGNFWTALADKKTGVAYFNKGNMGSILEKDNSFSIPLAYAMYYIWGTRMLYGSYDYEFAIQPFTGNWKDANLQRRALEYNFDVPSIEINSVSSGKFGSIIDTFPIIAEDDVILTGLYPEDSGVTVRFFKSDDKNKITPINFENAGAKIIETDLDGKFIRNVGQKINLKPWNIKTFQIQYYRINSYDK